MSIKLYGELFLAFLRSGLFTFGGGPSAIPLIQEEVVEKYQWFSVSEYADAVAFSNTLPGPIATKLSVHVGYNVAGIPGAVIATFAMVLPSAVGIILLAGFYNKYKETDWLKGMLFAVRPVIAVLLLQTSLSIAKVSFTSNLTIAFVIAGIAAVLLFKFNIHPGIMIVAALVAGTFIR